MPAARRKAGALYGEGASRMQQASAAEASQDVSACSKDDVAAAGARGAAGSSADAAFDGASDASLAEQAAGSPRGADGAPAQDVDACVVAPTPSSLKSAFDGANEVGLKNVLLADAVRGARRKREHALSSEDLDRLDEMESALRASMQKYQAAMRQMEVRFEILDQELSLRKNRNPIHHVEARLKKPASIYEKLLRYGVPTTIESMEQHLMDVAGVRVICSYIQDAYSLLDLLRMQDDLAIVEVKDYIAHPKPNGYRSLHVIVRIPVYFLEKKEMVPVEVQIRTIAMDFWASLEHDLKYKAVHEISGNDVAGELKDCSRIIEEAEARMQVLSLALDAEDDGAQALLAGEEAPER